MTDLTVSVTERPGAATVAVAGDLDPLTAPALTRAITGAVEHAGDAWVVVDVSGVRFCDSSGISSLVYGRRLAEERGVRYRVTGATGLVLDVLELTGVWARLSAGGEPGED